MERIVVDSGVVVKWFVVEPYTDKALLVLDRYQAGSLALLAPDLIYAEVGNIVWKKHRFQGLTAGEAQTVLASFQKLSIALTSTAALLGDAYQLAVSHGRTAYDAMYLALSLREQCRFVTADERFFNAVSSTFPQVVWVANW